MGPLRLLLLAGLVFADLGLSGCAFHRVYSPGRDIVGHEWALSQTQGGKFKVERDLRYGSTGLVGDLYRPMGEGTFPAVLVVHGGGWARGSRSDMNLIAVKLAQNGFIAFNVSYRFSPKVIYPEPVEDLAEAVRWLRERADSYEINPARIGAFGYSAGAHLVDLLALGDYGGQARVSAVVSGGGPTDLVTLKNSPLVQGFLGKRFELDSKIYSAASPQELLRSSPHRPAFFLYHGRGDFVVSLSQMHKFRDEALASGYLVETYEVPFIGHIATFLFAEGAVDRAIEFLRKNL